MGWTRSLVCSAATAGILGAATLAFADGQDQYYIAQAAQRYFEQGQNARTFGLGSSAIVTSRDSSSIIGNPAGLGLMTGGEFTGSYGYNELSGEEIESWDNIKAKQNYGAGLLAFPIGPVENDLPDYGNFGLGWSGIQSDTTDSIDTDAYITNIHGAYAKAIDPDLSVGYALTWQHNKLQSDLYDYTMDNGFRHTVGFQQIVDDNLTIGGDFFFGHGSYDTTLRSANGASVGVGDSNVKAHGFDVGLAYAMEHTTFFASVDYTAMKTTSGGVQAANPEIVVGGDESGTFFTPKAGVEYAANDDIILRGGYRYLARQAYHFDREELNGLDGAAKTNAYSLGIGLNLPVHDNYIKALRIDYGVEYRNVTGDWQHLVTLAVPFDVCERRTNT